MRLPRGIEACQRCGSWELRLPGASDGVIVGLGQDLSLRACLRCGLVAVPIEFESEEARQAYEKEQATHPSKDWPRVGWPSLRLPKMMDPGRDDDDPGAEEDAGTDQDDAEPGKRKKPDKRPHG